MHYQNDLFKSTNPANTPKFSLSKHLFLGIFCAIIATAGYAFLSTDTTTTNTNEFALTFPEITTALEEKIPTNSQSTNITDIPLKQTPKITRQSLQNLSTIWHEHIVKLGENLSIIFSKNKLNKSDLHKIIHANNIGSEFAAIRPGKSLLIGLNIKGELSHLTYKKTPFEQIKATRLDNGNFNVKRILRVAERQIRSASGTIHSSLFIDGKHAGLSDKLIMQLADIFAWDIDFALNLQEGDRFSLLYEALYLDNKPIGTGNILAAEFINHGKLIKTVRYTDSEGKTGYYSPDGKSMRKAFLRTPIDFARISSYFNLKRKHPVLNRIRAHKGVDYAARTGTPIKATADGKISFRGRKGGYGNVIIIQHGKRYSTLYAHMSKFKKKQKVGTRITQGDIIGYVGKSGLATGPHLHYEFRVDGIHRNPLTYKLPGTQSIQVKNKADFLATSKTLLLQLDQLSKAQLAIN